MSHNNPGSGAERNAGGLTKNLSDVSAKMKKQNSMFSPSSAEVSQVLAPANAPAGSNQLSFVYETSEKLLEIREQSRASKRITREVIHSGKTLQTASSGRRRIISASSKSIGQSANQKLVTSISRR